MLQGVRPAATRSIICQYANPELRRSPCPRKAFLLQDLFEAIAFRNLLKSLGLSDL